MKGMKEMKKTFKGAMGLLTAAALLSQTFCAMPVFANAADSAEEAAPAVKSEIKYIINDTYDCDTAHPWTVDKGSSESLYLNINPMNEGNTGKRIDGTHYLEMPIPDATTGYVTSLTRTLPEEIDLTNGKTVVEFDIYADNGDTMDLAFNYNVPQSETGHSSAELAAYKMFRIQNKAFKVINKIDNGAYTFTQAFQELGNSSNGKRLENLTYKDHFRIKVVFDYASNKMHYYIKYNDDSTIWTRDDWGTATMDRLTGTYTDTNGSNTRANVLKSFTISSEGATNAAKYWIDNMKVYTITTLSAELLNSTSDSDAVIKFNGAENITEDLSKYVKLYAADGTTAVNADITWDASAKTASIKATDALADNAKYLVKVDAAALESELYYCDFTGTESFTIENLPEGVYLWDTFDDNTTCGWTAGNVSNSKYAATVTAEDGMLKVVAPIAGNNNGEAPNVTKAFSKQADLTQDKVVIETKLKTKNAGTRLYLKYNRPAEVADLANATTGFNLYSLLWIDGQDFRVADGESPEHANTAYAQTNSEVLFGDYGALETITVKAVLDNPNKIMNVYVTRADGTVVAARKHSMTRADTTGTKENVTALTYSDDTNNDSVADVLNSLTFTTREGTNEFYIDEVKVYDYSYGSNTFDTISGELKVSDESLTTTNNTAAFTAKVFNDTGDRSGVKIKAFLAEYTSGGQLVDVVTSEEYTIKDYQTADISISNPGTAGNTFKAFIWKTATQEPICLPKQ